jgi:hypothetical protein
MTRLLDRPVRPKPSYFGPDGAPPGIALRLDAYATLDDGLPWTSTRPKIKPNTIVGHTNGASVEATVQSSLNYGRNTRTREGRSTTKPHYLLGDKPAKVLRSDLRGIANSTSSAIEAEYGVDDSSFWSLAVETADIGSIEAAKRGIAWPRDCGPFLYDNADDFAHIIAYEAIVWGFPIRVPPTFPAGGVVAHTWPWPYPYFTTKPGKTCPGATKIAAIRDEIIPRALQIRIAWTTPAPQPEPDHPEEADMAKKNVVLTRFKSYQDVLEGSHTSQQTMQFTGLTDAHVIVLADPTPEQKAAIEAELGHKLTPL